MLISILVVVIILVAWSLHLMQEAVDRSEFSLMLAGTLVAFSAAALVAVYCLMGNYIGYMTKAVPNLSQDPLTATSMDWVLEYGVSDNDSVDGARQMAAVFQL
jgi:hypothetical protein